ncbi:glycosyltransferase family 2 protein [Mesonia ostreae]|uniref:Glycosyltransferase n=1 Tax=Mesonia ostreae TaxID=861110 RepID=A0ABU2KH75_9FLAO|nr:glycosyltransferase [Mesonia ostreae]MDT0294061.1 glycosyltransferase [Mesonia ostreae]
MKHTPLISIVIPVYNEEDKIEHLLQLLKKQDHPRLEIVVVNDGSTDKTIEKLHSYLEKFNNYKFFTTENAGPGSARNYGISNASGTYIYFLDADDSFSDDLIKVFFKYLKTEKEKQLDLLVFGYTKKIIKNGEKTGSYTSKLLDYQQNNKVSILNDFHRLMAMEARLSVWNKVFRRELLQDNTIKFPQKKRTEDMFFLLDYIKRANNIVVISDVLYYHSSHYSNSKFDGSLINNHIDLYEKLKELLRENPNKENSIYLLNMFISWFAFVIPLNIYRNNNLSPIEKRDLLKKLFNDSKFSENLFLLNRMKNVPKKTKFVLLLLKLKSPTLLLNLVRLGEKVPRERIKKLMKT